MGGSLGSQGSRETLTHPAVPSHPAVPGFVGAAVTQLPKGSGAEEAQQELGLPQGTGSLRSHRRGLLCPELVAPWRAGYSHRCPSTWPSPPAFPQRPSRLPFPGRVGDPTTSPHPTDLWPRCAETAGRPPRGRGRGWFPLPPAGPSSFMLPPSPSQPGAQQLGHSCPLPRPHSQLSLGWGRAAGEQLQGGSLGGNGCPLQLPETVSGPRRESEGGGGEGKAWGMISSTPSPSASGQETPAQSTLPASKGTLRWEAGDKGGCPDPLSQHPRAPFSKLRPPHSNLTSGFLQALLTLSHSSCHCHLGLPKAPSSSPIRGWGRTNSICNFRTQDPSSRLGSSLPHLCSL